MKKDTYQTITTMQYILTINATQVGTGVLSLPRVLAEKAGTDGWISLLIGWFCSITASFFLVKTAKNYPNDTLHELLIRLFGKYIGKFILILYILYFAFYAWSVLINGMLYIKEWILPKTPDYIILFLFTIPTFIIVRNNIRIVGRYCELIFYMTLWIVLFFFIPLKEGNWLHFLPLLKEGWMPVFAAVPSTLFSFLGFEIAFILYPFLDKKHYAVSGIFIANTLTMLFYLFSTVVCFFCISPDSIIDFNQPVLNLLKVIEFRFLERFDIILLAIYIFVVSTAWIPFIYGTVFCSSQLLKKIDHVSLLISFLLILIGATWWFHPNWSQSQTFEIALSIAGLGLAYIFPFLLWLFTLLHKRYFRREIP
ncbi:spore gernimation protein [Bacillus thuringiensis serovar yunnanensis]|nr:spore gernimation protein [Bacillus thuringiensis serovar yunnanensis]